ncbi:MAG: cyclic nucleotide-binding domain-containing protein [Legionella sp.]
MSLKEFITTITLLFVLLTAVSLFSALIKQSGKNQLRNFLYSLSIFCFISGVILFFWLTGNDFDDKSTPYNLSIIVQCLWWFSLNWLVIRALDYFLWSKLFLQKGIIVSKILRDLISLLVIVITIAAVVHFVFYQSVLGIFTASGVVAIILGYSAQATLSDVFAGLGLNTARQFSEGDWIKVNGLGSAPLSGKVIDINWRFVNLLTTEGNHLSIPNSIIAKLAIVNLSQPSPTRGLVLTIPIQGSFAPAKIKRILLSSALQSFKVLRQPAPYASLVQFRGSDYLYQLAFYTTEDNEALVNDEINSIIWYQCTRLGIKTSAGEIPPPTVIPPEELKQFLQTMDLFACLTADDLAFLADNCSYHTYGPPELLLEQGQKNESLFIIYKGSVDVYIKPESAQLLKVASIQAGSYFGEMSLLTGDSVSASIVVNCETIIIEINYANMGVLFAKRPELIDKISEIVVLRKKHNEGVQASLNQEKSKEDDKLISRLASRVRDFYKRVISH